MANPPDCHNCYANPGTIRLRHPCAPNPMCGECRMNWSPCDDCDASGDCEVRKTPNQKRIEELEKQRTELLKTRKRLLKEQDQLLKRNHDLRVRAEMAERDAERWLAKRNAAERASDLARAVYDVWADAYHTSDQLNDALRELGKELYE